MVILALGIVMLINPKLMNQLNSSILVFGFALASAFLIFFIHKKKSAPIGYFYWNRFQKILGLLEKQKSN